MISIRARAGVPRAELEHKVKGVIALLCRA
jgi:hypothetical protein